MTNSSMPGWALVATLTAVGLLVLILLVVAVLALRARRSARRRLEEAEASEAELRERLEALERRLTQPETSLRRRRRDERVPEKEYVITSLGEDGEPVEVEQVVRRTLTAPAFADAVFRETVVHSAALVHGVRRALSPEVRFKIRYEMHREVKRARKDRKSEMREALREYRARQRAAVDDDVVSTRSTTEEERR
ncbi:type II secretory pathway pseudopilin PulG [Nocardioides luteus]|uniref:Uncharacterized protein n=1 Tax=Nocardioides luteus TaxID=1844 RepID=A0ABQ5T0G6_9ACTN|nr:hypothetical protein [Nocardioides luteus]MDR7310875.1 type II secretory pathway pseudopilin PulG [Nocardioides luteus]GGR40060.1 hypothetical protein GCM10010197_01210 [Nocardioides luteus]GLJ69345.1 hypothetical protein GCM10017579_33810 [Nocardioides luteus]